MTEGPSYGPDDVMRGLSLPRRVGLLVAGLGGLAAAVTIGLLLATEPGELPLRTRIAFLAMIGVGMAWAGFAGWALARRPLFAVDRVIAAWLAVTFSVLMTVGMVTVAVMRAGPAGVLAVGGLGVALTVVAGVLLARARAYRRALLARWHELERRNG
ncbi:hypothetical protein [Micromonospora sp. HUAS LYJ1]|uniref:hypothetical protein n=1 Tax=Micromonospora sp. HUAS LYJ1 TaxID=3061626 RepID=UPI002670EEC8|nr:hypothetical protein [Micromonospora sp. HUAS LYJ1]WKU05664.1 hypothetical protein Q2K16_00940 [Micromonospora sp. HUAS LYJ1]